MAFPDSLQRLAHLQFPHVPDEELAGASHLFLEPPDLIAACIKAGCLLAEFLLEGVADVPVENPFVQARRLEGFVVGERLRLVVVPVESEGMLQERLASVFYEPLQVSYRDGFGKFLWLAYVDFPGCRATLVALRVGASLRLQRRLGNSP